MQFSERLLLIAAGLAGAIGIAFHALAAHGSFTPAEWLQLSGTILLFHASALVALFASMRHIHAPRRLMFLAGLLFIFGLIFFSGDLAVRVFTGAAHLFPNAAPVGGGCLMLGWLLVAFSALALPR